MLRDLCYNPGREPKNASAIASNSCGITYAFPFSRSETNRRSSALDRRI